MPYSEADLGLLQHPRWSASLTIITKRSILDVAAALDPPLVLAITRALKVTSTENNYQEVGDRPEISVSFIKFYNQRLHVTLDSIPSCNRVYEARSYQNDIIPTFPFKFELFQNAIFLSTIIEWKKLDVSTQNSPYFEVFKKRILSFIRPSGNSLCNG